MNDKINKLDVIKIDQAEFLRKLKDKKEPYIVTIEGVDITVYPGVFPPVTDSKLLAAYIKEKPGNKILDLTTGSGVFAVIAGLQGATGMAVDLNPDAVVNANENFKHFGVAMKVIESDLFDKVPQGQFDSIFANGPYIEGEVTEPLEFAFYGAEAFLNSLFSRASQYLKPEGKILITFAEWGDLSLFERIAMSYGFSLKVLGKKENSSKRVYRLYEARLRS